MDIKPLLSDLVSGARLDEMQAREVFRAVMAGTLEPAQIAALLALIQMRGATVDELVGAARAMREVVVPVAIPDGLRAVDTCGTGGDHAGTFNVSTAAAILVAAAGADKGLCVAKHGNRAVTSRSGSSQVLEALGVTLTAEPAVMTRCLAEARIAFLFAPHHHPAMRHAGPVRQALGFRTLFNMLGPLTNPAGVTRQVLGVWSAELVPFMAEALQRLGAEHAAVVHGRLDGLGLDELSPFGPSDIAWVTPDGVRQAQLPARATLSQLAQVQVDGPKASAALIRAVFAGQSGPARELVVEAAAAALVVGGVDGALEAARDRAAVALDDGSAVRTLALLGRLSAEGGNA